VRSPWSPLLTNRDKKLGVRVRDRFVIINNRNNHENPLKKLFSTRSGFSF
jgi:hypothetical protein